MWKRGTRVTLRLLERSDLPEMASWHPFEDPLYSDANWPLRSVGELRSWYDRNSKSARRLLCAVINEKGQLIGSITLREREGRHSARLGITLGADFVDQGYGTAALILFLDYYFDELGYRKLVLDVVGYNRRAIRVYEKLGFVVDREYESPVGRENKWAFLQNPAYASVRRFFRRDWLGRYWVLCYDMELTREKWSLQRKRKRATTDS
jgi:diamine N-acetyltransferase